MGLIRIGSGILSPSSSGIRRLRTDAEKIGRGTRDPPSIYFSQVWSRVSKIGYESNMRDPFSFFRLLLNRTIVKYGTVRTYRYRHNLKRDEFGTKLLCWPRCDKCAFPHVLPPRLALLDGHFWRQRREPNINTDNHKLSNHCFHPKIVFLIMPFLGPLVPGLIGRENPFFELPSQDVLDDPPS